MKETIEQIMWSIRTYIAREYDENNNIFSFKNKNAVRYLIIYILCPILMSYIIVVGRQHSDDAKVASSSTSLFTILCHQLYNITILSLATLLLNLWHAVLRVIGITLGLGLGLGLAGHVYDVLSDATVENDSSKNNTASSNIINNNNSKPNFPKEHQRSFGY